MNFFDVREPVSTWTHVLGMVLAVPATIYLWSRCGRDFKRGVSVLIFGASLACCYLGSAMFHGVRSDRAGLDLYDRLDHVGIFVLIAGSYTPLAVNLLTDRWRRGVLMSVWGVALVGSFLYLELGVLPPMVGTMIYIAMGWGAIFCYVELSRSLTQAQLSPLLLGGVIYTVGAVINLAGWPVPWPGVFGPHETFHVLVLVGSFCHFLFMRNVVVGVAPGKTLVPDSSATLTEAAEPPQKIKLATAHNSGLGGIRPALVRVRAHERH